AQCASGDGLHEQGVGAQGEVLPVLLERADREHRDGAWGDFGSLVSGQVGEFVHVSTLHVFVGWFCAATVALCLVESWRSSRPRRGTARSSRSSCCRDGYTELCSTRPGGSGPAVPSRSTRRPLVTRSWARSTGSPGSLRAEQCSVGVSSPQVACSTLRPGAWWRSSICRSSRGSRSVIISVR